MPLDLLSEPLNKRVADEIRAEMARQRVTQTALAFALGWGQARVSDRLTGKTPLTLEAIEEIADVLRVQVERLFPFDEPRARARRRRVS